MSHAEGLSMKDVPPGERGWVRGLYTKGGGGMAQKLSTYFMDRIIWIFLKNLIKFYKTKLNLLQLNKEKQNLPKN